MYFLNMYGYLYIHTHTHTPYGKAGEKTVCGIYTDLLRYDDDSARARRKGDRGAAFRHVERLVRQ